MLLGNLSIMSLLFNLIFLHKKLSMTASATNKSIYELMYILLTYFSKWKFKDLLGKNSCKTVLKIFSIWYLNQLQTTFINSCHNKIQSNCGKKTYFSYYSFAFYLRSFFFTKRSPKKNRKKNISCTVIVTR